MTLELLSLLCTFENSSKCIKIFDSDSILNSQKVYSLEFSFLERQCLD